MKFILILILIITSTYTLASEFETIENYSIIESVREEKNEIKMNGVANNVGAKGTMWSGVKFTNFRAKAKILISNERKGIISISFEHKAAFNLGQHLFTLIETNSGMYQLYNDSDFKEPIGFLALFKDGFSVNFIPSKLIFMGTARYGFSGNECNFFLRNQSIDFKRKRRI